MASELKPCQIADALEKCDWAGASIGNKAIVSLAIEALRITRPTPAATETGLEPWGYGWFELGGKKMASGYLPTVNYPRSENVTEGPFPLYTRSQAEELLAAVTKERDHWKEYSSGQGKLIESGVFVTNDEYVRLTALEAKPTERDELVLYNEACEYNYEDGYPYAYMVPHPNGQYVSRSQAVELLAAKDAQIAGWTESGKLWTAEIRELQADNAAQAARIKELEAALDSDPSGSDLWRYWSRKACEASQKYVDEVDRAEALEAKLAAAEKDAATWEANFKALNAKTARAVLGGKPS